MDILQVSAVDIQGGAERIAWTLHQGYKELGQSSRLVVGRKKSSEADILLVPNRQHRHPWGQFWYNLADGLLPVVKSHPYIPKVYGLLRAIGQPSSWLSKQRGRENFNFPGSDKLIDLLPQKPDLIHCHNLHGDYFDLRALSALSGRIPLVLTLHDAWLLSGHCAHSFDCDRWKTGCGQCPDLTIMPAIKRDATAYNWQRKRDIYRASKLYVATPSQWLMDKVKQSILAEGIMESRVIPNGVDLEDFQPGDKDFLRQELGLPQEVKIILFTANGIRQNPWKDYQTMRSAVEIVAQKMPGQDIIFLALGDDGPPETIGKATIQFVPYQKDPKTIAKYYGAADLYIHAAKADTFPNTVLESLACGTPVVGTIVGGIPEQIEEGKTGFLVPVGQAEAMAEAMLKVLENSQLGREMGDLAAQAARRKYSLQRMIEDYLQWYRHILQTP